LAFRRCATCGCVIAWEPIGSTPGDRMGVNARLLDIDIESLPVVKFDGASMG
jgi:hypothetical protein